jgi:predicted RNA binding protein YcfA (HicA-like mRNA interferase family)
MSLRLKQLSGRNVAAALVGFGFEVVATRGSHCKLRRTLPSGERQTLTIPLHSSLAVGTLQAIYRQATRFIPEADLQPHFYTGDRPKPTPDPERPTSERTGGSRSTKNKRRRRKPA